MPDRLADLRAEYAELKTALEDAEARYEAASAEAEKLREPIHDAHEAFVRFVQAHPGV